MKILRNSALIVVLAVVLVSVASPPTLGNYAFSWGEGPYCMYPGEYKAGVEYSNGLAGVVETWQNYPGCPGVYMPANYTDAYRVVMYEWGVILDP